MDTPLEGGARRRIAGFQLGVVLAQLAAFAFGAWKGYGFGELIGGTPLGVVAALNLGVMAAVAVGTAAAWVQRRPRR